MTTCSVTQFVNCFRCKDDNTVGGRESRITNPVEQQSFFYINKGSGAILNNISYNNNNSRRPITLER